MTWTATQRIYFFGDQAGDDPRAAEASDDEFLQRYCAEQLRMELNKGDISPRVARRVFGALAMLAPSADHTSPKWNSGKPVVVIGRARFRKGEPPKAEVKGPRFGCCVHEGHLYVWAKSTLVEQSGLFSDHTAAEFPWTRWRGDLLRHKTRLDVEPEGTSALAAGALVEFIRGIEQKLSVTIRDARHLELLDILGPCRDRIGDPEEWDVIYPRLAAEIDEGVADDPEGNDKPDAPVDALHDAVGHRAGRGSSIEPTVPSAPVLGSDRGSMLGVLREVAIARVRTVIPNFDHPDLDRWIMSTGYAGALEPHTNPGDLLYVYAASITNAGGAKPNPEGFGSVIRGAYETAGLICEGESNRLTGNFRDIRHLAEACSPYLRANALGGRFADDILAIAANRNGRMLMPSLLASIIEFSGWLLKAHGGNAGHLHSLMSMPLKDCSPAEVFRWLRDLDRLPWMGIATAANFVKDSQVPGLQSAGLDPRQAADFIAGWFVKPDLHVARLMAYLTGRCPQSALTPTAMRFGRALALFRDQPAENYSGNYLALGVDDGLELKVIADIHEWAGQVGTSPLEIDRVLYLIGVREAMVDGTRVVAPWYPAFVRSVNTAIAQGVPRKS